MRFSTHKVSPANTGFTLIEVLVSVALFSIISVLVVGAFMSVLDANRKARAERQVLDSTQSFIELMTREIRDTAGFTTSCMGTSCSFRSPDGFQEITYRLNGTVVERKIGPPGCTDPAVCPWEPMTDAGVQIDYLEFDDTPSGTGVVVSISGIAQAGTAQETDFDIETTVAPRRDNLGDRDEFTRSIPTPALPSDAAGYGIPVTNAAPSTANVATWSSDLMPSDDIRIENSNIFCPWSGSNIPDDWVVIDIGHGKTNTEMPYSLWGDLVHSGATVPPGPESTNLDADRWDPSYPVQQNWLYRCNPLHQSVHMPSCEDNYVDPLQPTYTAVAGPNPATRTRRASNAVVRYEANPNPSAATQPVSVTVNSYSTPAVNTATCQLTRLTDTGPVASGPTGFSSPVFDSSVDYAVYVATDDYDHCDEYDAADPPNCILPCRYRHDPTMTYDMWDTHAQCAAAAADPDYTWLGNGHAPQAGEQVAIQLRDGSGNIIPWEGGAQTSAMTDDIATEANLAITFVGTTSITTLRSVDVMMRAFHDWVRLGIHNYNQIPATYNAPGGVLIPNYQAYCPDGIMAPSGLSVPVDMFASGASMGVGCIAFAPTPYPTSGGETCDGPWGSYQVCGDGVHCAPDDGSVCCTNSAMEDLTYCSPGSSCINNGQDCSGTSPGCPIGFDACGPANCIPAGTVCCAPEHPDKYCDAGEFCSPDGQCFTKPPNLQTSDTHLDINVEEF
jgi:prepilin-type N-terminal cleavage/methylation domain-containing protein